MNQSQGILAVGNCGSAGMYGRQNRKGLRISHLEHLSKVVS